MDTMEASDVVVKKEPIDTSTNELEDNGVPPPTANEVTPSPSQNRLRYVSRRGRPPGGGYSMKSHAHYISFNSAAGDLSRHSSLGGSLSTPDLLKSNVSTEGIDMRRFGFHGFDGDKSSFRCDGCDVVFSSRDTYAMHMLLRAKNESCVALPTSAISPNPENPTPREKFERELRQQAMLMALRNQATVMTKAAAMLPKTGSLPDSLQPLTSPNINTKDEMDLPSASMAERALNFGSLFCIDAFGVYVDPKQYRRFLTEYGLQTSTSSSSLVSMLEQMTCTLCGEMFSNKDSLAMHVMYHTRDEDNENKPGIAWEDLSSPNRTKSQTFSSSSNSSSSTSPVLSSALTNAANSVATTETKSKNSQSEDKELTAERVAELKRMAIESSLRSPPKKTTSSGRSHTRPKSVSQDASVADSAQTRPLSADDIMMLSNGCLKSKKSESQQLKDFYESGFNRKRGSDDERIESTDKESTHSMEVKKSRLKRENSSEPMRRPDTADGVNSEDSQAGGQKNNTNTGKIRSIPYLEAIMAQEAVLVPIEALETDDESGKSKDEHKEDMSALDFSRTGHDRVSSSDISPWYTASSKQDQRDERQVDPNGVKELVDRYVRTRNLYYPNASDSPETSSRNQGHFAGANGTSFNGRPSRLSSEYRQSDRFPRGLRGESPGRSGEARYCPHCEILFLDVTLFHLHMGLHNVNNPWQCNTCGLVCSGRLDFNTHVLHY